MTLININLETVCAYEKCNFLKLVYSLMNAASQLCKSIAIHHHTTQIEEISIAEK